MSISVKELNKLDKETYELIDIRSDAEIAHGVMPVSYTQLDVYKRQIKNREKVISNKKR